MADDIDRAQEREQQDRDRALAAMQARIDASFEPRDPRIDDECIDCEQAIEPERLRVLGRGTSRCSTCAHDHAAAMAAHDRRWGVK